MGKLDLLTDEKCINLSLELYTKYKNESWILSPKECLEKSKSWFGNEKFKIKEVKYELKNKRIIFGLKSGVFFLSNRYPKDFKKKTFVPGSLFGKSPVFGKSTNEYNVLVVSEKKSGKKTPFIRQESIQFYINSNDFNETRKEEIFHFHLVLNGRITGEDKCIMSLTNPELMFLKELKKNLLNESKLIEKLNIKKEKKRISEEENTNKYFESKFTINKKKIIKEFDADNNGKLDIIEDGGEDFMKILQRNQSKIIEVDKKYIQKFIKISNYLNDQKDNAQKIFIKIKEYEYGEDPSNTYDNLIDEAAKIVVKYQSSGL